MLPYYQVTKVPSYKVTKLPSYKVTKLPSYQVTNLQSYQVTKLPSYQVTKLKDTKLPSLSNFFSFHTDIVESRMNRTIQLNSASVWTITKYIQYFYCDIIQSSDKLQIIKTKQNYSQLFLFSFSCSCCC